MTRHGSATRPAVGGDRELLRPVAFVFGAGMARAAAQTGMIRAATAAGLTPDIVVGSSWGAVSASAMASLGSEAVPKLGDFWQSLAEDKAWTSRFRGVIRALTPKRSEGSAEILREHLSNLLGDGRLDDAKPRACCVATDLVSGLAVELSTGMAVDAVMAAAAVPLLLPPVVCGGQVLVDGGIVAPAPVRQAMALGARTVVLLDVGAIDISVERAGELKWYEIGITAYSDMLRSQTGAELAHVARTVPVIVFSAPAGELLNFREAPALIDVGSTAVTERLPELHWPIAGSGIYGTPQGMEEDERLTPFVRRPRVAN